MMSDLPCKLSYWLLIVWGLILAQGRYCGADTISYARDIQVIFAQNCLNCHGPDTSEGGLRLDHRANATQPADSGEIAIVPGDVDASELYRRIVSDDPDVRMPPEGEPLASDEVDAMRQWIAAGAPYDTHWSYRPLTSTLPPASKQTDWIRNDIDRFVLAKLEAAGIPPSTPADRYTLIKRLAYDLHGVPPTIESVDAFVDDAHPNAYERLVDGMLASPRFAERWARHWLDKARYADSDGYEKDNNRPDAWRYRDWVIRAIHEDLPFDQFTTEQLAGDLLPKRTEEQILATAFNRQTLTNTEGGTDREQWRVAAVMDRTETFGTVWLGLTVGCARCHNHKYDQFTQKEYYELYAYFDNADETNTNVLISDFRQHKYEIASTQHQQQRQILKRALASARSQSLANMPQWETATRRRLDEATADPIVQHSVEYIEVELASGKPLDRLDDGSLLASHRDVERDTYTLTLQCESATEPLTGIVVETIADDRLPKKGPGLAPNGNYVITDLQIHVDQTQVSVAESWADFSQDGWHVSGVADGNGETGWAISPQIAKSHRAVFRFAEPLDFAPGKQLVVALDQQHKNHLLGRFRVRLQSGIDSESILPADLQAVIRQAPEQRAQGDQKTLESFFLDSQDAHQTARRALAEHNSAAPKPPRMSARVLAERQQHRRQTHVLRRGEFKQKLEPVTVGTPATLTSTRDPTNRLEFAQWLVDGDNPIVPRVAVNQIWDHLFGYGLVRTVNDFGVRGEPPTHVELLDWMAGEYVRLGWSRKRLIKTIVMSATYRQSSHHRQDLAEIDPTNRLLSRQNRFRLEAESIRDSFLAVAGLLSDKIGGPSVFPPIPSGITDLNYNSSFKWQTSSGEDRFRRGMYTFFKRTAPHPNLTTFDCPDSNVTCVKRNRSNTPLAALVTLNNAAFHEAAQSFARNILAMPAASDQQRLAMAVRRCIARPPDEDEIAPLVQLLGQSRTWFADHSEDAQRLVGNYGVDGISAKETATWVATLRMVLNLDEFITRE